MFRLRYLMLGLCLASAMSFDALGQTSVRTTVEQARTEAIFVFSPVGKEIRNAGDLRNRFVRFCGNWASQDRQSIGEALVARLSPTFFRPGLVVREDRDGGIVVPRAGCAVSNDVEDNVFFAVQSEASVLLESLNRSPHIRWQAREVVARVAGPAAAAPPPAAAPARRTTEADLRSLALMNAIREPVNDNTRLTLCFDFTTQHAPLNPSRIRGIMLERLAEYRRRFRISDDRITPTVTNAQDCLERMAAQNEVFVLLHPHFEHLDTEIRARGWGGELNRWAFGI